MSIAASKITNSRKFNIASGICFSPATDDGCIVLNVEQNTILSLNDTGARMFAKLAAKDTGLTRDEFVDAISYEFQDIQRSRIELAIDSLLTQLEAKRLLQKESVDFGLRKWLRSTLAHSVTVCSYAVVKPLLLVKADTVAALLMLATADVVLKIGGFSSLHRTVSKWKLRSSASPEEEAIGKGRETVDRACTWLPKQELCLQRSAVVTCLLRSLGVPAEMVIGVHKMPFYSHAWVEVNGTVINDHKNVQTFFHVLSRC